MGPGDCRKVQGRAGQADVRELAIHLKVGRMYYSRGCAEASAVQAHVKQGIHLVLGMKIGNAVRDAKK